MAGRNLFANEAPKGRNLFADHPQSIAQPQPAQQPTAQQVALPQGNLINSIVEPAVSIGSNLLGTVAGGVSGLVSAPFVGLKEAQKIQEGIQQSASDFGAPETQAGVAALKNVGDVVQKGVDLANIPVSGLTGLAELATGQGIKQAAETVKNVQEKGFGTTAGDRVFEETGSALLATVAKLSPEIAASIFPVLKIAKANKAGTSIVASSKVNPDIKNPFTPPTKTQVKIAESLSEGGTDKTLARYISDGAGKVKSDKIAVEAIKQGFDSGVIAAVKGASSADKSKMLRMVNISKRGKENALFAVKNRPTDVAGDSLLQRIKHVRTVNKNAGSRLDVVAKSLKGKKVDFSDTINEFLGDLDNLGIKLNKQLKPVFKGSDIEGLAAPEAAINNIVNRLSKSVRGASPDAHDLHRMKRFIDEIVTYGKSGEGLKGQTERILKKLRRNIDSKLDSNFPEYDRVNTVYAETINALDGVQDVAGKKMNLSGGNADKATGTLLRRMMSNAQSRVNLVDAVDQLESISKKHGSNFSDDITTQMLFADELDSVFGAAARTSLRGEVGKSVKDALDTAAGNRTVVGTAIEAAAKGADKLRGINEANAFKSIKDLLER